MARAEAPPAGAPHTGFATTVGPLRAPSPAWLAPYARGLATVSLLVSSFSDPLSHLLRFVPQPAPRPFLLWARLALACARAFEGCAAARLVLLDADPRSLGLHGDGDIVAQAPEAQLVAPTAALGVRLNAVCVRSASSAASGLCPRVCV